MDKIIADILGPHPTLGGLAHRVYEDYERAEKQSIYYIEKAQAAEEQWAAETAELQVLVKEMNDAADMIDLELDSSPIKASYVKIGLVSRADKLQAVINKRKGVDDGKAS